jgi:MFS family permease
MGLYLTAQMIPSLVFLLVGGIAADRLPRRTLLLLADGGRAVVVLVIALLCLLHLLQLWHLLVLGFLFGIAGAFFQPAFQAIPPQLVERSALPSANALTQLSIQVGILLGPVVGAICITLAGPSLGFAFDGLTFLVSVLSLWFIRQAALRAPATQPDPGKEETGAMQTSNPAMEHGAHPPSGISGMVADLRDGLSYILHSTWLLVTIVIPSIGSLGSAVLIAVVLPKLIYDDYEAGVWLLGAFGTAVGLGWMTATFLVGQLHLRRRGLIAFLMRSVASLALLALGLPFPHSSEPVVALIAGFLYGLGTGTLQTIWVTLLHELVPNEKLGRVSSIDLLGSFLLTPLGYLLAGSLADHLNPAWVFLAGGILNLLLNGIALSLRDIRSLR